MSSCRSLPFIQWMHSFFLCFLSLEIDSPYSFRFFGNQVKWKHFVNCGSGLMAEMVAMHRAQVVFNWIGDWKTVREKRSECLLEWPAFGMRTAKLNRVEIRKSLSAKYFHTLNGSEIASKLKLCCSVCGRLVLGARRPFIKITRANAHPICALCLMTATHVCGNFALGAFSHSPSLFRRRLHSQNSPALDTGWHAVAAQL